ncbi:MAG: hypothetical protein KKD05_11800 [Candidatus Omnitrophica bacterium]|nr:hypothetical protein [Candidatus Omnitrophota bacterium]
MDKKYLNNKGLSLVEVVMSALLLTVVLAALFASYRNANNLINLAHNKLIALNWAESVLEHERANFGGAYTDPASPNWLTVEKSAPAPTIARINYGAPQAHLQEIKVTITWTE